MTARMTAAQLVAARNREYRDQRKPVDHEGPLHRAILAYLRAQYPGAIIHHSPNSIARGDTRTMNQVRRNRAMGTVKGWPDLTVLLPGGGVWLFEVKAPGNGPDKDQRALHAALRGMGHRVAVVRSIEDVQAAIAGWASAGTGQWQPNSYSDLHRRIVGDINE